MHNFTSSTQLIKLIFEFQESTHYEELTNYEVVEQPFSKCIFKNFFIIIIVIETLKLFIFKFFFL